MMVNQPNPNDEVVKCVVVGDSGVGKTCLVCAWTCNAIYELKKLVKTHVATVWAIDHYQRDREVLERSWCEVDGVRVSLRLWDTFGYHDKDRRFAYRGADVILLCFSTVHPGSLRNVRTIWYPEIRRFCPTTPIILVGTQTDLRYLYNDDTYLKMEKGLMYRPISEVDIVTPAMGHDVAKDIGAPFYESSVLTRFGVSDVFINSVRAALIERRKLKFWNTQLRKVQRPLIQPPMVIPAPALPPIHLTPPSSSGGVGLGSALHEQCESDVTLVVRGVCVEAHRVVLAISCQLFHDLFSRHHFHHTTSSLPKPPGPPRLGVEVDNDPFKQQSVTSDDRCLLDNEVSGGTNSPNNNSTILADPHHMVLTPDPALYPMMVTFQHPAVEGVEVRWHSAPYPGSGGSVRTVVTLHPDITPHALHLVLDFLYTCRFSPKVMGAVKEVRRAAELLALSEVVTGLNSFVLGDLFTSSQVEKRLHLTRQAHLHSLALRHDAFLTDVVFEVDDGRVAAHKVLLMAGCEMMHAMFSNSFLESSADVVSFPGINCDTFRTLLEYIYTGEATSLSSADCLSLIETANRLCLPHLVSLAEAYIVSELQHMEARGSDPVEEAILLLEPAELHNAKQLSQWCEKFLCVHYREATQQHSKLFRSLPKERQEAIEKSRWPPTWYLKEVERYERYTHDRCTYPAQRQRQDYNRCFTGCLCFSRRARHRLSDPVDLPI
ncbi:rho-related BTB domain-containing protein 1-like isoform X2 [Babylonia areolata]